MKVLQLICPLGFYGAERWVVALGNNSDPAKVQCDLAVTKEGDYQNLEIAEAYPTDRYRVFKLSMSSSYDLSVIRKLAKLVKEEQIDIIHTHGYKSDIIGFLAAKLSGAKCISTPHGFGKPTSKKLEYFIRLGKFFLRFMEYVVPLSRQLEREVLEAGVKSSRVEYIQNGVDLTELEDFIIDHDLREKGKKEKVIGFVGQMIPRKNIRDLLDVFDAVWKKDNSVKLKLLGDGEERVALEQYTATLSSREAIEFLGFRSDRLDIMKEFDIFAMTSRDEGIPRCLMEAMAMQIPVAAYDIAGIDQLVTDQKTGLLAKFGDKAALESKWLSILEDPALSKQLGESAREFVLDHFSAKRMADQYYELYKKILRI